jgi:hypothetical protein
VVRLDRQQRISLAVAAVLLVLGVLAAFFGPIA